MDFFLDELIEAVPVVICNKNLLQFAPPSQCFFAQRKSDYWVSIRGYPPMEEYREPPKGYDWWFSVFLDCPGIFLLDAFYQKKNRAGCLVNVKVRHGMNNLVAKKKDGLTNLSWIDGERGLCEKLLLKAFWLSAIQYVVSGLTEELRPQQVTDINELAISCALQLRAFSGAKKSAVKENMELLSPAY